MEITLYLDIFFMVNFSMDFFLLWLLRMILKLKGSGLRLAAGGGIGAALSVLVFGLWLAMGRAGMAAVCFWGFSVSAISSLMVFVAFRPRSGGEFIRIEAGLLFGAALVEGILQWGSGAWLFLAGAPLGFYGMGTAGRLFFLAGGLLLAEGIWRLVQESAAERSCRYQVKLFCQGRQAVAEGFLDTGNRLRDPVSGKPVHVADRKLLLELCPKAGKVSMIPYRTIDGGGAVLTAVTLDRMEAVQGKRRLVYERPLVAASPVKLQMKNGCRVLLHE